MSLRSRSHVKPNSIMRSSSRRACRPRFRSRRLWIEPLEDRRLLSVTFTGVYSQNFDGLAASGTSLPWTNDATLAGWSLFRQPAPGSPAPTINASDGSTANGTFYSFGSASGDLTGDRALGGIGAGTAYFNSPASGTVAGWMAVSLTNGSGAEVNLLSIHYDGEQWRNAGNSTPHAMSMEYGFGGQFADVTTWTAAGAKFSFTSPIASASSAALDGNSAANRVAQIGGTLTNLGWEQGATLWVRWVDDNNADNDHGLAIDNVSISVNAWASQHGDLGNTSRADYAVPAERLNDSFFDYFLWQTRTPNSPSDGNLSGTSMTYFDQAGPGGTDLIVGGYHWPKGVQGMDRHTGQVFWSGLPAGGESIGVNSAAFSNDGSVIYVTNDATDHPLMAFHADQGPSNFWHNGADANPNDIFYTSPKVGPDGRVYLHRFNDGPRALVDNGEDMSIAWSAETGLAQIITESALYQDSTGLRVVAAGRVGLIASYDGVSGDELWQVATGHFTDADVTVDPANGKVYVPMGFGDIVVAGLSKDGAPLWGAATKLVHDWTDGADNRQRSQSGGALSHDGATFYFQTDSAAGDGRLYAINTIDGSVKWSYETHSRSGESGAASSPIVTRNGVVIIGNNEGDTYYAIRDVGTHGELLDTLTVDSEGFARASATLSPDGKLYLPLRVLHTTGRPGENPTFQVQNLFTAIDLSANPQVTLPPPGGQKAFAGNHQVALSWTALPDPTGHLDHYAVYRSTSAFTSVAGMTPIATVAANLTSYTDATAENGVAYYYAVTSVSTTASEATDVAAIGPRTPRDEIDLQVVSIARSPEFDRYAPNYINHEVTEPSGYGPYYFSSSSGLGNGQTFVDPRFPAIGQVVTYTATVRNRGTYLYAGNLAATWTLDGVVTSSPVQLVSLDPGDLATYQFTLPWDFGLHELTFTIQTTDARLANNSLTSDPLAVPFLTYIDESFVEKFREEFTTSATQNDDIIDWLNEHMQRFNEVFAAAGTQKRVHYGVLEVIDDDAPEPNSGLGPYAIFPLRYHDEDGNPRGSGYYHSDEDIDYGLLHEMGHQLGLIDVYQLNVSPEMNLVSGQAYHAVDDLMNGVSTFMSPATALAMEHWLRDAHGYFGQYMYNMPETMQLRILGQDGQPLQGATVKVYQVAERPGVGKVISNQVKFQGVTGADGIYTLPNVPINPSLVPAIGTGDVLHDNPFGYLDVVGRNGVFHISVEHNGFVDYAWFDVTEANVAYWQGDTDLAVFDRQVSLGGPVQYSPPADMTELNAADWEAWADGASAAVSDDTTRKIVGASSLKFVTDGGFDTYVRYPGNQLAVWNVSQSDALNISFFAENPSPFDFQNGSPWIRLLAADGDYVQFQYYVNGEVATILNEAIGVWKSYQIPLDAAGNVQTGWRSSTFGTPDLTAIAAIEIHADTWDNGFTLWIDGVSFDPPLLIPGDYTADQFVDGADFLMWQRQFGASASPSGSGADGDKSGVVDAGDLDVWAAHFGEPAATAASLLIDAGDSQKTNPSAHDAAFANGDMAALFASSASDHDDRPSFARRPRWRPRAW